MNLRTANKHRRRVVFLKRYRARRIWVNTAFFLYRSPNCWGPKKTPPPKGSDHE